MKIMSIVGARPQFIKLAPVSRELNRRVSDGANYDDLIVHTGQHYDRSMSDVFFDELQIPETHADLNIGSGNHGTQTGAMLGAIESQIVSSAPDVVVVYGDTNSTLAGCLAATKLHIPVVHVEAGLRSFNRRMPEEINRIVADHTCDLLLAPTPTAVKNLNDENLSHRTKRVGDVMYDAVLHASRLADSHSTVLDDQGLTSSRYGLVTIHRAENTTSEIATGMFAALESISRTMPLVFPMHPRTRALITTQYPDWNPPSTLKVIEPVGYFDMMKLLKNAQIMLTDSGGVQKEAMFLGTPCVTLREETEWVETVETGANRLAGTSQTEIERNASDALAESHQKSESTPEPAQSIWQEAVENTFGKGDSAKQIVDAIDTLMA